MRRVYQAIQKHKKKILTIDNVVGVGRGIKEKKGMRTGDESIVVFVEKKIDEDHLQVYDLIPKKIDDRHTDVVEVGEIKLLADTNRYRPVKAGCSVGHEAITAGTLGMIVRDIETGRKLLLSNNHVLANLSNGNDGRAKEGDRILQPGVYDGGKLERDVVAYLYKYKPIFRLQSESECPVAAAATGTINSVFRAIKPSYSVKLMKSYQKENLIDAALGIPTKVGIADDIIEIGQVRGTKEPRLGEKVKKRGRTTGYTEGVIKALDVTMRVSVGENSYALFTDQVLSNIKSGPGDSGSLVLDEYNNAVGLLFAGSNLATLFNRITNVTKELGIKL